MDGQQQVSSVCAECGAPISFAPGSAQVSCDYCGSGMAVQEGAYLVRLDCPACAGNFYYLDGSMAGACPYCETRLLALTRDRLLRYVVTPDPQRAPRPQDAELVFVPFWRLSALLYRWDIGKRQQKAEKFFGEGGGLHEEIGGGRMVDLEPAKVFSGSVVNRHLADPATVALGISSLRLRGALNPVEPFRREHEQQGRVIAPVMDYGVVRDALYEGAMDLGYTGENMRLECQRADVVAETVSLLYYPFWLRGRGSAVMAWDAVSGDPEQLSAPGGDVGDNAFTAFDELQLLELRCGNCSAPLALGNHAVVYPCHECSTFWVAEREGLRAFEARYARPTQKTIKDEKPIWLPFWRVGVSIRYCDREARTVGDLRTALGVRALAGDEGSSATTAPLRYFAPAYGSLRAPRVDHAAREMTRLQPQLEAGDYEEGEVFHCFFGPEDAERLGYATWIQLLPGADPRRLRSLRLQIGELELWYLPFGRKGRELRNLLSGRRYERSAFRGVGH